MELVYVDFYFFFFKQKTAYEMRISDWSSDVCSSDLFLLKSGLDAKHYIATGVILAIIVDLARLPGYFATFTAADLPLKGRDGMLIAVGTLSAFAGAWVGARYMKKATIGADRKSPRLNSSH